MKEKINTSKICALFVALLPILKIVSAPAMLAEKHNEKLWLAPLLCFLLDLILISLLFYAFKKHKFKNAYEILNQTYSKVIANTIFLIWAVFFCLKCFLPLIEHKQLIERSFYETLPKAPVFLPFFAVCFYICIKGFKPLLRTCQILAPLSFFAIILIIYLSLSPGDLKNLLPLNNITLKSGAISVLNACSWFGDAVYLVLIFPNQNNEKKPLLKLFVFYLIAVLGVIIIYVLFYAIFSSIASTQLLAISSMSIFSLTLVNIGRFDHLSVLILSLCSVFAISLPALCSVKCISTVFNLKTQTIPAIIINALLLVFVIIFSDKYKIIADFYFRYLTPFLFTCEYLLPLLLLGGTKNVQKG